MTKRVFPGAGSVSHRSVACAIVALMTGVAAGGHTATANAANGAEPAASTVETAQIRRGQTIAFNIPGGPLPAALAAFGERTGLQILYPSDVARDAISPGVSGNFSPDDALEQLLSGTGLYYRFSAANTVTVQSPGNGVTVLSPITVEGKRETATGPVDGFVAERSASGTKTDTPLLETPQSVSVITADEIKSRNVNKYSDVLRYTPGVEPELYGLEPRYTNLSMRGLLSTTTALFQDGMGLVQGGYIVSYNLEPWGAERVEVPRGPASVLYGQGSPGGLVNYVSKRPAADQINVLHLETGSYNRRQAKFDIGGAIDGNEDLAFRLTGLARRSDTMIDYLQDNRLWIAPQLSWRAGDDTKVTFFALAQEDDTRNSQALPGSGTLTENPNGSVPHSRFTGEPDIDQYHRTEYGAGYELEHRVDDALSLRQKVRYHMVDLNDDVVYGAGFDGNRTLSRAYYSSHGNVDSLTADNNAQFKTEFGGSKHTLLGGVDIQFADMETVQNSGSAASLDIFTPSYGATPTGITPAVLKNFIKTQYGLYAQDQIEIGDHWRFTLGGRYDWAKTETDNLLTNASTTQRDEAFTGRAGLVYLFDNGLAPYASYSESFLPITDSTNANGDFFEPETGQQYEVGVKYQPPGHNSFVTVAAFDLRRQNYTEYDNGLMATVQTGEVRSQGVEVEGLASLDLGLDIRAAYTFLQTEVTESTDAAQIGGQLRQVPQHTATAWADYTFPDGPFKGFGIGAGVRYQNMHYGDNANTLSVPGRTLFDAGAHYEVDQLRFGLNVQNLLDEEHLGSCYYRGGTVICTAGEGFMLTANVSYEW